MPITPLDVKKKTFGTQLRGVSPKEVTAFLALVAKEMEQLRKERGMLAEKVDELSARLEQYERTEDLLKETLLTAQKTTGDLRTAARQECDAIKRKAEEDARALLAEATQQADKTLDDTRAEAAELRRELDRLAAQRTSLLQQMRGIMNSFSTLIDRWEAEPASNEPNAAKPDKR